MEDQILEKYNKYREVSGGEITFIQQIKSQA